MGNHLHTISVENIYQILLKEYGNQHWWPADDQFEIIIGAILTQAAAWSNVEKALGVLKENKFLSPSGLRQVSSEELSRLIYPCGYYNSKAKKVKAFVRFLGESYDDDLYMMFKRNTNELRSELLNIYGIGEETADSILLYAAKKPVFVIDAYTRRICSRLGLITGQESYLQLQQFFMNKLVADVDLFGEYHALLVRHGKSCCRVRPLCNTCCLHEYCGRANIH